MIDRDPPPPPKPGESQKVTAWGATATASASGAIAFSVTWRAYPEPPLGFTVSPDVETLWRRWEGYLSKREPLQATAYFCLTVVEAQGGPEGGSRPEAARLLRVDPKILSTLGRLTP